MRTIRPIRPTVWTALVTRRFVTVLVSFASFLRSQRGGRLLRRLVFPACALALVAALGLAGYARMGGSQASMDKPYFWNGGTVFIAGSTTEGLYTTCTVTAADGEVRKVDVPGEAGGIRLTAWFDGTATLSCGQSVSVTAGWQSILYPIAENRAVIMGLAAATSLSWWLGRGTKASTVRFHPLAGYKTDTNRAHPPRMKEGLSSPLPSGRTCHAACRTRTEDNPS